MSNTTTPSSTNPSTQDNDPISTFRKLIPILKEALVVRRVYTGSINFKVAMTGILAYTLICGRDALLP